MMSRIFTALYVSYIATAFVLMEVNPTQWLEGGRFSMLLLAFMVWILQTALAAVLSCWRRCLCWYMRGIYDVFLSIA